MEENIRENKESKEEIGEMKKIIERYKNIKEEVKKKRVDMDKLM